MAKLNSIRIDVVLTQQLRGAGISSTDSLLNAAGDKQARAAFTRAHGIDERQLMEALNRADLARIKGVSTKYSDLLEEAGIDTVPELAQRNPANLYAKLREVNEQKQIVTRLPRQNDVDSWVSQAKGMDRAIYY